MMLSFSSIFARQLRHVKWNTIRRHIQYELHVSTEVQAALWNNSPIVALESTIITHGMPYPQNWETASQVEEIIRDENVIPATIGIIQGRICVGLSSDELKFLAQSNDCMKISRRDVAFAVSQRKSGGTTVCGTMLIAHRAGIPIFVTGGLGGVHRDVATTLDISSDLRELGRTPVAVISSGVKSILDIARTLEYLETEGVTVATVGPSKNFPAFFTAKSNHDAPFNVETPAEAAELIDANLKLDLGSGILVAVPVPENEEVEHSIIENAIQQALEEARQQGITGRDVTPYVLKRLTHLTGGLSLLANKSLIANNARVGAQIAKAYYKLQQQHYDVSQQYVNTANQVVVIGGSNVDFISTFIDEDVEPNGATYKGYVRQTIGGVGRNHADALTRLDVQPLFLSVVGQDEHARTIFGSCPHMNFEDVFKSPDKSTSCYSAILRHSGEVIYGIGDFDAHSAITPQYVEKYNKRLENAALVLVDGNVPAATIEHVVEVCYSHQVPVWFEPTNQSYLQKIARNDVWKRITYISPNLLEMTTLGSFVSTHEAVSHAQHILHHGNVIYQEYPSNIQEALQHAVTVLSHIPNIILTAGPYGVFVCRRNKLDEPFPIKDKVVKENQNAVSVVHYPVRRAGQGLASITSVSGAGDCLNSAMIWCILKQLAPSVCITTGLQAAQLSLRSHNPVPNTISPEALHTNNLDTWVAKFGGPKIIL